MLIIPVLQYSVENIGTASFLNYKPFDEFSNLMKKKSHTSEGVTVYMPKPCSENDVFKHMLKHEHN